MQPAANEEGDDQGNMGVKEDLIVSCPKWLERQNQHEGKSDIGLPYT